MQQPVYLWLQQPAAGIDLRDFLNFLYFFAGTGIGIVGLYLTHKYFLAGQQDKFNHIAKEITEIKERLASVAEYTSQQASVREERLLDAALRKQTLDAVSEQAATDIQALVLKVLEEQGVPEAVRKTAALETPIREVVARSAEAIDNELADNELAVLGDGAFNWLPFVRGDRGQPDFTIADAGRAAGMSRLRAQHRLNYAEARGWVRRTDHEHYRYVPPDERSVTLPES